MYDVIVIGAGAAGLSSAIYAVRRSLKTLVLSKDMGGATATTEDIENYPGYYPERSGYKLMQMMEDQAKAFGTEIEYDPVVKIEKKGNNYSVHVDSGKNYETKTLIFAHGRAHRHLDVPGEHEFFGKGIVYCATCDSPLYRNKITAVVGGGNSALDAALLLSKIASKIYLIHRRDKFRGEQILIDKVKKEPKIELILNAQTKEIKGKDFVTSIVVEQVGKTREIPVDGVFVEVGFESDVSILQGLNIKLDDQNQIIVNDFCETNVPGIFAAGDITTVPYKQTVISSGQGAIAALRAYDFIHGTGIKRAL